MDNESRFTFGNKLRHSVVKVFLFAIRYTLSVRRKYLIVYITLEFHHRECNKL